MATSITLQGRSGARYGFTVYPWGTGFQPVGAVYAILRTASDGIIYIGQTGDMSERFDNHHKSWCFRSQAQNIGVRVESSERQRLAIESDLLGNYRPPCND